MYKECCKIIGVEPGSNEDEIRKAYRKKAKLIHPDLNPSADSHAKFIILQGALEYLIQFELVRQDMAQKHSHTRESNAHFSNFHTQPSAASKPKNEDEFGFLKYSLGKFIFIFFHVLFIGGGIFMIVRPAVSLIRTGISDNQNPLASVATLVFSMLFGIAILRFFLNSSLRLFKQK